MATNNNYMSGIVRQIQGEVAQSKKKGSAYKKAIQSALSPENIVRATVKTQKCESYGKK